MAYRAEYRLATHKADEQPPLKGECGKYDECSGCPLLPRGGVVWVRGLLPPIYEVHMMLDSRRGRKPSNARRNRKIIHELQEKLKLTAVAQKPDRTHDLADAVRRLQAIETTCLAGKPVTLYTECTEITG